VSADNVDVVRRLIESFQQGLAEGDLTKYDARLVAPDLEWIPDHNAALGVNAVYRGAAGFGEFMRTWTEGFDEWMLDVDDDRVLAIVRQTARGKASGAPVELHQGVIYELRDGRVIRIRNYLDPAEAIAAAGLSA